MDASNNLASCDTLLFLSGSLPSSSSISFVALTSAVFSSGAAVSAEDSEVGEAQAEWEGATPTVLFRFSVAGFGFVGGGGDLARFSFSFPFAVVAVFVLVVVDIVVVVAEGAGPEGGLGLADLLPTSGTELLRLSTLFPFVNTDTIALALLVCADSTVVGDIVRCCCCWSTGSDGCLRASSETTPESLLMQWANMRKKRAGRWMRARARCLCQGACQGDACLARACHVIRKNSVQERPRLIYS